MAFIEFFDVKKNTEMPPHGGGAPFLSFAVIAERLAAAARGWVTKTEGTKLRRLVSFVVDLD